MTRPKTNPLSKPEAGRLGGSAKVAKGFAKMAPERLAEVLKKSHDSRVRNAKARKSAKQGCG